ncbi:MAG: hypothetical protein K6E41_09275 [Solobacterium sp.]|nr:hypothetical protein [Solobacterium sp.]
MTSTFVVIDLETTGLDQLKDEIIEIAAVKIKRGLVIDEFSSLVNIDKKISAEISALTGITNDMLADQPRLNELIPALADFIGSADIAAHNAAFDRGFLTRSWPDQRQWIDTLTLAQIVYPCEPSHSLAWLTQAFGIENPNAHRAMSDALATAELLGKMIKDLTALPDRVKEELTRLAESDPTPLGALLRERCQTAPGIVRKTADSEKTEPPPRRVTDDDFFLDIDEIGRYLGENASFKERIPDFEDRPQQLQLAEKVAEAFNRRGVLLAEAGTGTGKSLAYLLPSALYAQGSGKQVAVSTHTRNLQEQLLNKDVPLLSTLLDRPVNAAVLKGRGNYLCKRLYRYFSSEPSDDMRYFLMRLAVWRGFSNSGDGGELSLTSYFRRSWQRVCASKENCAPFCPFRKKNACYVQKARARAAYADILILNHSLLIANAANEVGFLPELPFLVLDEAQHLADATEDQLTTKIDFFDILNLLSRYKRREKNTDTGVLLTMARAQSTLYQQLEFSAIQPYLDKLNDNVDDSLACAEKFYDMLDMMFSDAKKQGGFFPLKIRITENMQAGEEWGIVAGLGEELAAALSRLSTNSFNVLDTLRAQLAEENMQEELPRGFDELFSLGSLGRELAETIRACLSKENDNYVAWAEYADAERRPSLNIAPIEISELLAGLLYEKTDALVMTSATLSAGKDFSYFKHQVGLDLLPEPPVELTLASPFMYNEQALLTVVNDLPDWSKCSEIEASSAISSCLIKLLSASKGRAIVLFTSHYQLRSVYNAIREPLKEAGVTVLAHGISGAPSMLLERLKKEDNCCILGAASFWEGVDVIGGALSLIVVVRLPFWPPNTPLAATRMERIEAEGRSSFKDYSLPMALIRFKQGFGRLIRSDRDSGVFCVLDKRIVEKRYGSSFLQALPEMSKLCGDTDTVAAEIEKWLR